METGEGEERKEGEEQGWPEAASSKLSSLFLTCDCKGYVVIPVPKTEISPFPMSIEGSLLAGRCQVDT